MRLMKMLDVEESGEEKLFEFLASYTLQKVAHQKADSGRMREKLDFLSRHQTFYKSELLNQI